MYLSFFQLSEMPFSLTPNTHFFCALEPHNEAMQVLLSALSMAEGFIKVTGEVGTGKTLLCRKLLNHIEDNYVVAYLPNPYLTPDELRWALASELGLELDPKTDQQALSQSIEHRLLALMREDKKVVMIIDEAQCLSWDALEALRLFTNLETESRKLLQVVLFGQPELDQRLANPRVRQLRQRIGFSFQLRPMTPSEVVYYIQHRLRCAGAEGAPLFSKRLSLHIARASRGIPRLVNVLCHKVLLQAYGEGTQAISKRHVKTAILDTEDCRADKREWIWPVAVLSLAILSLALLWWWRQQA